MFGIFDIRENDKTEKVVVYFEYHDKTTSISQGEQQFKEFFKDIHNQMFDDVILFNELQMKQ